MKIFSAQRISKYKTCDIVRNFRYRSGMLREGVGLGVMKFAGMPLGLFAAILLARMLGTEGYGQYTYAISIISFISLAISGGLAQLLTRDIAIARVEKKWGIVKGIIRRSSQFVLTTAFLIVAIAYYLILGKGLHFGSGILFVLPVLPLMAFGAVWSGTLRGFGHVQQSQLPILTLIPACNLASLYVLYICNAFTLRNAILALIITYSVSSIVGVGMMWRATSVPLRSVNPEYELKKWAASWLPFVFLALMTQMNTLISILTLGTVSTDTQIAAFQVADRGAQFVTLPFSMVGLMLAPRFAQIYKKKGAKALESLARKSARVCLLLTLPVALAFIFQGHFIIGLVLGSEYAALASVPLAILSAGQVFNVIFGAVGLVLAMTGHEKAALIGQAVALVINIALVLFLAPTMGAVGAAIGTAVAMVVWNVLLGWKVWTLFKIRPGVL